MATNNQYPQASQPQQYHSPPTSCPPPPTQFQFAPPPGPPPSTSTQSYASPPHDTSPAANPPQQQQQAYGYPPPKAPQAGTYQPPPPHAPPTPLYSPMSNVPINQQAYYSLANAPPTPASTIDSRSPQSGYQTPSNATPQPQYVHAAPGYGGATVGAPTTSYFPPQPQAQSPPQQQPLGTQIPSTTDTAQLANVATPPVNEQYPDMASLSLSEKTKQTYQQYSSPPPQQQYPTAEHEKAKLQQAYNQYAPQTSYTPMPSTPAPSDPYQVPPPPYSAMPQITQMQQQQQQQQQQYQTNYDQQWQSQQQTYAQQPYYDQGQGQEQYTQIDVHNPVMGLQQTQYAQAEVQQLEQFQTVQEVQPETTYGQEAPPGVLAHKPGKDSVESGKVQRFLGDTLFGRVGRSSWSTVTTTIKMPAVLSPWGDNNPVTLPNVRYRDAALFGTFAVIGTPLVEGAADSVVSTFGADHFISEVVGSSAGFITGNTIVKYGVFQIVEQAIDKGVLEHALPEVEKTLISTNAKTLQICLKHKLMGVEADIRMHGTYQSANSMACDKGWFAPYLFSSSRTPVIQRSQDFAMAQVFKPYLIADTLFTHKLITESASVIPLCDPTPTARFSHARLAITFLGLNPFRGEGAGMWSQSRRPGCGQLRVHLLNGCPTLVIPAVSDVNKTPVMAWSPWTLRQMAAGSGGMGMGGQGEYTPQKQHSEICGWLLGLVDRGGLHPSVAGNPGSLERVVGKVVTMIINGALTAPGGGKVCGVVDPERAGLVAFRF